RLHHRPDDPRQRRPVHALMVAARSVRIASPRKQEGPPLGAALPLSIRDSARAGGFGRLVTRRGPRTRPGSRWRCPAGAVEDNETLDHLLSVVAGRTNVGRQRALATPCGGKLSGVRQGSA